MDTNLITEIADIQAIKKNIEAVIALTDVALKGLKKEASQAIDFKGLADVAKNVEKVTAARKSQKQVLSELEKVELAIKKTDEFTLQNNFKIEELLSKEVNTIAELTAQNKALENVRKNLDFTDKNYEKTQNQIIAKENENIAKIKEFQNVEQQRTSGIGKYEEAIKNALNTDGNYRSQLLVLRNTMASLEIEKEKAIKTYGAESKEVKALTEQYDVLEKKAGEVTDKQGDMQARIKYLADDYGKLKAVLSGVQAAMGMVAVVKGATELLGFHSEAVEKVTAKMTALIATMQGLKQVQELLDKDNYFARFIKQQERAGGAVGKFITTLKSGMASLKAFVGYASVIGAIYFGFTKALKALSATTYEYSKSLEELIIRQGEAIKASQEHTKTMQLQIETEIYQKVAKGVMSLADAQEELEKAELKATEQNIKSTQARIKNLKAELSMQKATYEIRKKQMETPSTLGLSGGGAAMAGAEAAAVKNAQKNIEATKQEIESAITSLGELEIKLDDMKKELGNSTDDGNNGNNGNNGNYGNNVSEKKVFDFKSITSKEEEEMYTEQIEWTSRKLKGLIKEAEKGIPPIQIDIPIELEDPKIEQLKSALETLSDEIAKQLGFFYTKINSGIDGEGNVWKKMLPIEDLRSISNSVEEVITGLMNTSQQVLNNVVGNAIKMSNEEFNTRTQAAENEANIAKEALETSLLNEEDRAEAEERIEKEKQRKLSDLKNEQAKKERDAQAAEIAVNAVMAFASTLATAKGGMAAKLIQAAAVSAVALSQLAVLYSKPLPKYERGGVVGSETSVIAGERGRELAFTPDNKVLMLDSKGIYNLPTGTIIKDNHTTEKILKEKNINISVSRDYIEIDRQKYINKYLNKTL